jgi:ribosomal protein S18 acetylase RimI-like enzyme
MEGHDTSLNASAVEHASASANICAALKDVALRAATEDDTDFLRAVFSSTRMDEFASAGLPLEQIESLLASQFSLQHDYYQRHYPGARFDVITCRGSRVGRLYHDWNGGAVQLIDIALLPAHRGAGIGSQLMRALVVEADRKHVPIRLYVEFNNPVRSLYRRLGFVPAGENGVYELMQRDAVPFEDEGAGVPTESMGSLFYR